MRPQPDELTSREREVLALIRLGLTNEEIAQRLDISLAGAKYHVSEILSKLGVATREEAAAIVLAGWHPWWVRAAVWAKIGGAATVTAAVAGVALLVWGVLRASDEDPSFAGFTLQEAYTRIENSIERPGLVLHTTISAESRAAGSALVAAYTKDIWVDSEGKRIREEMHVQEQSGLPAEIAAIFIGSHLYLPDGGIAGFSADNYDWLCPSNASTQLARVLECGHISPHGISAGETWQVETGVEYEGKRVIALVAGTYHEQPAGNFTPGAPIEPGTKLLRTETKVRLYIDPDTYLPIAQLSEYSNDGEYTTGFFSQYQHEFIPAVELPADLFDPRSIGYAAADLYARLDEIAGEIPVYWLGEELAVDGIPSPLVLARVEGRGELNSGEPVLQHPWGRNDGRRGELVYRSPAAGRGVSVVLWEPSKWDGFLAQTEQWLPANGQCFERTEFASAGKQALLFAVPPIAVGPGAGPACPQDWRQWTGEPPAFFAYVELEGVVVQFVLGFMAEDEAAATAGLLLDALRPR